MASPRSAATARLGPLTMIGCGGVGMCVVASVPKMLPASWDASTMTIIDKDDEHETKEPVLAALIARGAKFINLTLTKANLEASLDMYVGTADNRGTILDLSVGIGCIDILGWAAKRGARYINTALELWEEEEESDKGAQDWLALATSSSKSIALLEKRTLYMRQLELKRKFLPLVHQNTNQHHPEFMAVIDHGMNPGLVSHFTKVGLQKVAKDVLSRLQQRNSDKQDGSTSASIRRLADAVAVNDHAMIASLLDLRVIHISEADSQIPYTEAAKKPDEFLCTWSPAGFHEEGLDPVQVGWGTHERTLPTGAIIPSDGLRQQIFLPQRGAQCFMRSYVPRHGDIKGYNIPHSEGATLAAFLSQYDAKTGDVSYRPTVHYVYQGPKCGDDSWAEVLARSNHAIHPKTRVLGGTEIASGHDAVGVLLLFPRDPLVTVCEGVSPGVNLAGDKPVGFWAGTILDITQTREALGAWPAPTTVQVAASVLSAVLWMAESGAHDNETKYSVADGRRGGRIFWPEALPSDKILDFAGPWLGDVVYEWVHWEKAPQGLQFIDMQVNPQNPRKGPAN